MRAPGPDGAGAGARRLPGDRDRGRSTERGGVAGVMRPGVAPHLETSRAYIGYRRQMRDERKIRECSEEMLRVGGTVTWVSVSPGTAGYGWGPLAVNWVNIA